MILIADSGSTKTDWRLIDEKKQIHQFLTQGINPYFNTTEQIAGVLKSELISNIQYPISNIFFYGAGCRVEDKKKIVELALLEVFPNSKIVIHSDILGAAHSLCGKNAGIVAILGTGANTCYYDGSNIAENRTSAGFIKEVEHISAKRSLKHS